MTQEVQVILTLEVDVTIVGKEGSMYNLNSIYKKLVNYER